MLVHEKESFFGGSRQLTPLPPPRPVERGAEGVTVRGHMGARGSELSGLENKIHQLKLRTR